MFGRPFDCKDKKGLRLPYGERKKREEGRKGEWREKRELYFSSESIETLVVFP